MITPTHPLVRSRWSGLSQSKHSRETLTMQSGLLMMEPRFTATEKEKNRAFKPDEPDEKTWAGIK